MLFYALFELICLLKNKHSYPTGWKSKQIQVDGESYVIRYKQCHTCKHYLLNEHTVEIANMRLYTDFINGLIRKPVKIQPSFSRFPALAQMLS